MKFEEQFPSLKGQDKVIEFGGDGYWENTIVGQEGEWVRTSNIKEHCLDKQKVREAIDKVFDMSDEEDAVHNAMIKKELGL